MRKYGRWSVTLPGETYTWEPDAVTLGEQLMLQVEATSSYQNWIGDVGNEDAEACQILVWFLRRKAGRQEDRLSIDFPIRELDLEQIAEQVDDPEAPAPSEGATSDSPLPSESPRLTSIA
jgi:hypothetical protein